MKNIYAIFKREVLAFFVTPRAYFVICGFVFLAAYFFFNLLQNYNLILQQLMAMPYRMQQVTPNMNEWIVGALYQTMMVVLVFLTPILTMRLISEEKRSGTFELLATSPLNIRDIVIGKFLGAAMVVFVMMALMFAYPVLLCVYGDPGPEMAPMLAGLLGITLYTLSFVSIGMAVSSFSKDQIVSAISSMVILLLFYVIHAPAESLGGLAADILNYLSPVMQAKEFLKGVIDLKAVVYFLSVISFGLFLSHRALEAQRWR